MHSYRKWKRIKISIRMKVFTAFCLHNKTKQKKLYQKEKLTTTVLRNISKATSPLSQYKRQKNLFYTLIKTQNIFFTSSTTR